MAIDRASKNFNAKNGTNPSGMFVCFLTMGGRKSFTVSTPTKVVREEQRMRQVVRQAGLNQCLQRLEGARRTWEDEGRQGQKPTFASVTEHTNVNAKTLWNHWKGRQVLRDDKAPREPARVACPHCLRMFADYFLEAMSKPAGINMETTTKLLSVIRNFCTSIHRPNRKQWDSLAAAATVHRTLDHLVEERVLPELAMQKGTTKTFVRARAETKETGEDFLADVADLMRRYRLTKKHLFFLDETGVISGMEEEMNMFGKKKETRQHGISRYKRRPMKHVTATVTQSAAGRTLTTQFLSKGPVENIPLFEEHSTDGQAAAFCTKSAYQTHDSFVQFLMDHLVADMRKDILGSEMVVLLLDNAPSHILVDEEYDQLIEMGVILQYLPPNTTAIFCSLDVGFFGPLKAHLRKLFRELGAPVQEEQIPRLFMQALATVATEELVQKSFKKALIIGPPVHGDLSPDFKGLDDVISKELAASLELVVKETGLGVSAAPTTVDLSPATLAELDRIVADIENTRKAAWLRLVVSKGKSVTKTARAKLLQIGGVDKVGLNRARYLMRKADELVSMEKTNKEEQRLANVVIARQQKAAKEQAAKAKASATAAEYKRRIAKEKASAAEAKTRAKMAATALKKEKQKTKKVEAENVALRRRMVALEKQLAKAKGASTAAVRCPKECSQPATASRKAPATARRKHLSPPMPAAVPSKVGPRPSRAVKRNYAAMAAGESLRYNSAADRGRTSKKVKR